MLKENIQRRIVNTKFESNKSLFARETGLNRDEIVRILSGKIKNPGIYTIAKIAAVLHCSVDDLLGTSSAKDALHSELVPFCETLFLNSVKYISNYIEQNKLKDTTAGRVFLVLDTIYSTCHDKGQSHPDVESSAMLCKHSLK